MTHDDMLLANELDLAPAIDRSPEEWERIQTAVLDRRVADIPVPTETASAWCTGEGLDEAELCMCLNQDERVSRCWPRPRIPLHGAIRCASPATS